MRKARESRRFGTPAGRGVGYLVGAVACVLALVGCGSAAPESPADSGPVAAQDTAEQHTAGPDTAEQHTAEQHTAGPDTAEPQTAESAAPTPGHSQRQDEPEPDSATQQAISTEVSAGREPATLSVPAIGLDEDLIDLGLQDDGSLEVPTDWSRVGWFTGGGKPGGHGPTVMVGHLDSTTGPAVFYELTEVQAGDLIEVTDVDGTLHTYEVYRVQDLPKDDYPTQEVFGATSGDELRLITCTGEFDAANFRHLDNRVVFAATT